MTGETTEHGRERWPRITRLMDARRPARYSSRNFQVSNPSSLRTRSVSSRGGTNGIVWANEKDALRAYDADSLGAELWNSTLTPGDACGTVSKNAPPTIANGKVYLASLSNQLCVYGLVPPAAPTNLIATSGRRAGDAGLERRRRGDQLHRPLVRTTTRLFPGFTLGLQL
jgi:hypothetical protein